MDDLLLSWMSSVFPHAIVYSWGDFMGLTQFGKDAFVTFKDSFLTYWFSALSFNVVSNFVVYFFFVLAVSAVCAFLVYRKPPLTINNYN